MQQHTGQHVLSAILADTLGYPTVGVHFGRDASTLDLDTGTLPADQVIQAEQRANAVVVDNLPVEVTFEEAETAIGLRRGSARTGTLRVVNIQNLDRSACGGTHVRATGEIGAILIRRAERVRKGIRLEFLCGARAIHQARADYSLISRLAGELSAAPDELPRLIDALRTDVKEGASLRRELETKLDLYRARELYGAASPDQTGIRRVLLRQETGSLDQFRGVAQAVASMRSAIFVGVVASPPAVLLAASPDAGVDAAGVLKGLLGAVGGRGGGSTNLAQGVLPGPAQLEQVLLSLGVGQESRA
jgi:alanyl-tRNA synthetase